MQEADPIVPFETHLWRIFIPEVKPQLPQASDIETLKSLHCYFAKCVFHNTSIKHNSQAMGAQQGLTFRMDGLQDFREPEPPSHPTLFEK
jgi:hypothetical protein